MTVRARLQGHARANGFSLCPWQAPCSTEADTIRPGLNDSVFNAGEGEFIKLSLT